MFYFYDSHRYNKNIRTKYEIHANKHIVCAIIYSMICTIMKNLGLETN